MASTSDSPGILLQWSVIPIKQLLSQGTDFNKCKTTCCKLSCVWPSHLSWSRTGWPNPPHPSHWRGLLELARTEEECQTHFWSTVSQLPLKSVSLHSTPSPKADIVGIVAVCCWQHSEEERLELQYSMEGGMWYRAFTLAGLCLFLNSCSCEADCLYRSWANPWELREQTLGYNIQDFAKGLHL